MSVTNSITTVAIAVASSGNNEIVAAVAGVTVKVIGYRISAASTVSYKWRSASTDRMGASPIAAGVPDGFKVPSQEVLFQTEPGEALNLNLSDAVAVGGFVYVYKTS